MNGYKYAIVEQKFDDSGIEEKELRVFDSDTRETLTSRIASVLRTIPKYVYYEDKMSPEEMIKAKRDGMPYKIRVRNLLNVFLQFSREEGPLFFNELIKRHGSKFNTNQIGDDEIFKLFVVYIEPNLKNKPYEYNELIISQNFPANFIGDYESLKNDNYAKANINQNISDEILKNVNKDLQTGMMLSLKEQIAIDDIMTKFRLTRTTFEIKYGFMSETIDNVFNETILSDYVPFASTNKMCKVYNKVETYKKQWVEKIEDNKMILQVSSGKDDKYTDVIIDVSKSENKVHGHVTIKSKDIDLQKGVKNITNYSVQSLNNGRAVIESVVEEDIGGVFEYGNRDFDVSVFADLVLNDEVFSSKLSINEQIEGTRTRKKSVYMNYESSDGLVKVVITRKKRAEDEDITDERIVIKNMPYLRVKIKKAKTLKSINEFRDDLAVFLALYDLKYDEVVWRYRRFLPEFPTKSDEVVKESSAEVTKPSKNPFLSLKFIPTDYARYCQKSRQPDVVSDEKAEELKALGKKIMKFPKLGDGPIQHNFVCMNKGENKNLNFPGLRHNPLDNKDKYPFLPCCFGPDQEKEKGSIFRHYFFGEPLNEKEKRGQQQVYLLITDKIVPMNNVAEATPKMKDILMIASMTSVDSGDESYFRRLGVARSKSSFLDAVITAKDAKRFEGLSETDRINRLNQIRKSTEFTKYSVLCRQSCYDMNIDDVSRNISSDNVYLDPSKYIRAVEEYCECHIVILKRNDATDQVEIMIPRHMKGFLEFVQEPNRDLVIVYEHMGSESDNAAYPQCEIVSLIKGDVTQTIFKRNTSIIQGLLSIRNAMTQMYLGYRKLKPYNKLQFENIINGQELDAFGKVRMIYVKFANRNYALYTDILPPLLTPEIKNTSVALWPVEDALKFCTQYGISVCEQLNDGKSTRQLVCEYEGIIIRMQIKQGDNIESDIIPISRRPPDYIFWKQYFGTESVFTNFEIKKKIAQILYAHTVFMLSKWMERNKKLLCTSDDVKNFLNTDTILDDKYKYNTLETKLLQRTFSPYFNVQDDLYRGGKLILNSQQLVKKLHYALTLECIRDIKNVIEFKQRKCIPNYYDTISSYTKRDTEIVISINEYLDIINEKQDEKKGINKYNLRKNFNADPPYFIQNDDISSIVFAVPSNQEFASMCVKQSVASQRLNVNIQKVKHNVFTYNTDGELIVSIRGDNPVNDARIDIFSYVTENSDALFQPMIPVD